VFTSRQLLLSRSLIEILLELRDLALKAADSLENSGSQASSSAEWDAERSRLELSMSELQSRTSSSIRLHFSILSLIPTQLILHPLQHLLSTFHVMNC
jgi:hypothetical protein